MVAVVVAVVDAVVEVEVEAKEFEVSDFIGTWTTGFFFFLVHKRLSGRSESSADADFLRFLELLVIVLGVSC